MYTILYLRDIGNDKREHRKIECNSIVDAGRIYKMLRMDSGAYDLSLWQGSVKLR